MTALVLAEAGEEATGPATRSAIAAARALGPLHLLVCGSTEAAAAACRLPGLELVLHCADTACAHGLAEPLAALLASLAPGYSHLVAPASAQGRNVMPRLAALLDMQIVPDVVRVVDANTFMRPFHAGNALATLRSDNVPQVLTTNILGFDPVPAEGGAAPCRTLPAAPSAALSQWLERHRPQSDRPDLGAARVVVAGGRGLGGPEAVPLLEHLADRLGGAVGASLGAVEAGFMPADLQVGQSGRSVAPELYIAAGISGAVHHLAGMQGSKVVVAINLDPDAPIHAAADFSLVADLHEALPALTAALDEA